MLVEILKKIGRLFIILTHEDSCIDPAIKNILLISLPSENHLHKAIEAARFKFKKANFKIILPPSKIVLISSILPNKNIFPTRSEMSAIEYRRQINRFKSDEFDAVIILSLTPFLVWEAFKKFKCHKLLYNYCDEWYLIRRKTIYEFFSGKKGADRQKLEKDIFNNRIICSEIIDNILKTPFRIICILAKFIKVSLYIGINILLLSLRRAYYKLLKS